MHSWSKDSGVTVSLAWLTFSNTVSINGIGAVVVVIEISKSLWLTAIGSVETVETVFKPSTIGKN